MLQFWTRYDLLHVVMTLVPLVVGGLGALLLWHRPDHLGKTVIAYALICIGVALSPWWLRAAYGTPEAELRPVLVETKLAFVVGLAFVLAAGGRARPGGKAAA